MRSISCCRSQNNNAGFSPRKKGPRELQSFQQMYMKKQIEWLTGWIVMSLEMRRLNTPSGRGLSLLLGLLSAHITQLPSWWRLRPCPRSYPPRNGPVQRLIKAGCVILLKENSNEHFNSRIPLGLAEAAKSAWLFSCPSCSFPLPFTAHPKDLIGPLNTKPSPRVCFSEKPNCDRAVFQLQYNLTCAIQ